MKFCVDYKTKYKLNNVDEVFIEYNPPCADPRPFIADMNKKNIKVILKVGVLENDSMNMLEKQIELFKDYNIAFCFYRRVLKGRGLDFDTQILQKIREHNIDFFYRDMAATYEEMYVFIDEGASEIYITNDLCFSLKRVSDYCKSKNVRIRVLPNICQSNIPAAIPSTRQFFVNPYNIDEYEDFVDTFEIYNTALNQEILVEIYKSKEWKGKLGEIIQKYNLDMNASSALPVSSKIKLNCGRRCLYGSDCRLCDWHFEEE